MKEWAKARPTEFVNPALKGGVNSLGVTHSVLEFTVGFIGTIELDSFPRCNEVFLV